MPDTDPRAAYRTRSGFRVPDDYADARHRDDSSRVERAGIVPGDNPDRLLIVVSVALSQDLHRGCEIPRNGDLRHVRNGGTSLRHVSRHKRIHAKDTIAAGFRCVPLQQIATIVVLESAKRHEITGANEQRETRSEEHTSELQSRGHLVCRLLLEKK